MYLFCTLIKSKIVVEPLVSGGGLDLSLLNYKLTESPLCDSTGSSFSVVTVKAGWEALGQWPQIPFIFKAKEGTMKGLTESLWFLQGSGLENTVVPSLFRGAGGYPSFWVLPTVGASLATFSRIDKSYLTFAWIK